MPRDEHGEYKEDAGSPHPVDPDEAGYEPCNAVLRHTWERYGERRYCSALAVGNFESNGTETNYEHPQFCKHHQDRAALMKQHEEDFKTGAHAKSHKHQFQYMPPHKQLLANDLYKSLLNESEYEQEWDAEITELEIDVADDDFGGPEIDTIVLEHPVPQDHEVRAKALWHAALDFVTMESIREEQFRVAAEETVEGRELAIGETKTYVSTDDDFKEVADEHHLNLPLSRIQKDYERHLNFGGVAIEGEGESTDMGAREWVMMVEPDEEVQPEAQATDASPLDEIAVPEPDED